uniref:30S ribosomal protein S18 n=1 Tax=Nephromyces sp. ex Molgula occidentalis TaxID=2544991 RepID=A0A5C1H8F3_9APIC|nr:hypothetical protein [Nephromyces sp. ex Molgula occidentalis]
MNYTNQILNFQYYLTKNKKLKKKKNIKISNIKYKYIIKLIKYYRILGIFPFLENKFLKI